MTEYVVWCETHGHYLVHVSVGGTSWRQDPSAARRYPTKPQARTAAERATWLSYRPVVWAVAGAEQ